MEFITDSSSLHEYQVYLYVYFTVHYNHVGVYSQSNGPSQYYKARWNRSETQGHVADGVC